MHQSFFSSSVASGKIDVRLDGISVELPASCRTLNAIRCRLEARALARQRILSSFTIDGREVNLSLPMPQGSIFCRVEAETVALCESPVLLLKQAMEQVTRVRDCVETALTLVLINDPPVARELWWNLAGQLKEPVLTLSLLPDDICGEGHAGASLTQLRKWQLEQIASIISEADDACNQENTIPLSNALEKRVLPWLENLSELIKLWHDTILSKRRLEIETVS